MRRSHVLGLSFAVIIAGGVMQPRVVEAQADEGICTWNLNFPLGCVNYDPEEECNYHVENECHDPHWTVYSWDCNGETMKCYANWP